VLHSSCYDVQNVRYLYYVASGKRLDMSEAVFKFGNTFNKSKFFAEEITSRLRSGSSCYHSVQNLLSSSLLSKNLKTKVYSTIILPVVLYGCETWSLTLQEERKLRVFKNMVLKRIFGPRGTR